MVLPRRCKRNMDVKQLLQEMPQLCSSNLWRHVAFQENFSSGSSTGEDLQTRTALRVSTQWMQGEVRLVKVAFSLPIVLLADELVEALDAVPSVLLIGRISGLTLNDYSTDTVLNSFNVPHLDKTHPNTSKTKTMNKEVKNKQQTSPLTMM